QAAEIGQRRDRRKLLQVALEVGAHVAVEPNGPGLVHFEVHSRSREAAAVCQRAPVLGLVRLRGYQVEPVPVTGSEQLIPEAATCGPRLLAPRHWPEGEIACAAGE